MLRLRIIRVSSLVVTVTYCDDQNLKIQGQKGGEPVGGVQHLKEVHCFLLSLNFFYCCHPADQEQLNGRQAKLVRNTIVPNNAAPASIRANFLYFSLFSQTLRNLLIFSILWIFRLEFDDLGLKKPLYASTKDPQGLFFSCHSNLL